MTFKNESNRKCKSLLTSYILYRVTYSFTSGKELYNFQVKRGGNRMKKYKEVNK